MTCPIWQSFILQLIQKSPKLTFTTNLLRQLRVDWYKVPAVYIHTDRVVRLRHQVLHPSSTTQPVGTQWFTVHSDIYTDLRQRKHRVCVTSTSGLSLVTVPDHTGADSKPSPFIALIPLNAQNPKNTVRTTYLFNFKAFFFYIHPLPSKPWHTPNGIWYLPFLSYIFLNCQT